MPDFGMENISVSLPLSRPSAQVTNRVKLSTTNMRKGLLNSTQLHSREQTHAAEGAVPDFGMENMSVSLPLSLSVSEMATEFH